MSNLWQQRDGLQPSEALLNALPLFLTDGTSDVLRRASINGTSAWLPEILATWGGTFKFRHSATKSAVSYALSPRPVTCLVPGICANITSAASRRPFHSPRTPRCSRSSRGGSLPEDSRCRSTWLLYPCPCGPATHPDRSSIHASRWTAFLRESQPWRSQDRLVCPRLQTLHTSLGFQQSSIHCEVLI